MFPLMHLWAALTGPSKLHIKDMKLEMCVEDGGIDIFHYVHV